MKARKPLDNSKCDCCCCDFRGEQFGSSEECSRMGEAEEVKKIRETDRRLYEVMRDGTKMPPVLRVRAEQTQYLENKKIPIPVGSGGKIEANSWLILCFWLVLPMKDRAFSSYWKCTTGKIFWSPTLE